MAGEPFIKKGAKGKAVMRLQKSLVALGFDPGTPDGVFGKKTRDAVKAFQASRGLIDDGEVGPKTWAALNAAEQPPPPPPPPVTPEPDAAPVPTVHAGKTVRISLEQGNKFFASIDGSRFFVGSRVSFGGNKGLMNATGSAAQRYDRAAFRERHGFWADFIHPTSVAEGALYHTLNTYDRAHFTFSFLQYGAHVPNGDFVVYFRELLKLPLASEYFPELRLDDGRITRVKDGVATRLESNDSTLGLMKFLNPTPQQVEDSEVIQAAKFIHWAQNDPEHRRVQLDVGVAHFKSKMAEYAKRYNLDGVRDSTCFMVADIRHQGRAKSTDILSALGAGNPFEALLNIGAPKFKSRLDVLRREIGTLESEGIMGRKKYSVAQQDFIDA